MGTASKKLRTAGAKGFGEPIEMLDEIVVQLDQNFAAAHDQMVSHMVEASPQTCFSRTFGNRDG